MPKQPEQSQVTDPAVQTTAPGAGAPSVAEPQAPASIDFDAAWNGLDEPVRAGIAERLYGTYNQQLEEQYGDIIPLVREASSNPSLRSALKEFASDAELRNFIADGGTLEQIRGLQKDPDYREFLFKDATDAYRKYPKQTDTPEDPMAPFNSRISALENQLTEEQNTRTFTGYIDSRKTEMEALQNAAPALKENRDLLAHIVSQAENNYKIAAANSGINVAVDDKIWAAQAVRQGIRPPQYIDVYRQYERLTGKTPPPAAPSGSTPTRPGRGLQAPRTKVEGTKLTQEQRRAQAIEQMKKRTLSAVKS